MLRVVEGSIHVLLLSFFVVLEMFFHFKKNILYCSFLVGQACFLAQASGLATKMSAAAKTPSFIDKLALILVRDRLLGKRSCSRRAWMKDAV
jgi:hypothetical protein